VPWEPAEFFASGVYEIDAMLAYAESIRPLVRRQRALDFGCGVGRLTQALARHFEEAVGVDISSAMIEHAKNYDSLENRCRFLLNDTDDLRQFTDGEFDFVYSSITLQHMPPHLAARYIQEFIRVLRPDGLALFQLPSRRRSTLGRLKTAAHEILDPIAGRFGSRPLMRGTPTFSVRRLVTDAGGEILDIAPDESAGPDWESYRYLAARSRS